MEKIEKNEENNLKKIEKFKKKLPEILLSLIIAIVLFVCFISIFAYVFDGKINYTLIIISVIFSLLLSFVVYKFIILPCKNYFNIKDLLFIILIFTLILLSRFIDESGLFELFFNFIFCVSLIAVVENRTKLIHHKFRFYLEFRDPLYQTQTRRNRLKILEKGNKIYNIGITCFFILTFLFSFFITKLFYRDVIINFYKLDPKNYPDKSLLDVIGYLGFFSICFAVFLVIFIIISLEIFKHESKLSREYYKLIRENEDDYSKFLKNNNLS